MTIQEEVIHYLENNPKFRERKYRGSLLMNLALKSLSLGGKYSNGEKLTTEEMCQFAVKFDSYRHAWGDVTRECPELRGNDYADGERLEQEKLMEMGYRPNYHQDVKKLKQI